MLGVALISGSAGAVLWETPDAGAPATDQVRCRTLEVGICGTDREIVAGGAPIAPPGQSHLILGHECLAEVEEVGPGVADFAAGDLVAPLVRRRRESADPDTRLDLLGWGDYVERGIVYAHGFATPYWLDDQRHLIRVEPGLRELAVLTEPQSVAEKAVNEAVCLQSARLDRDWAETKPRTLVLGLGPIGYACAIAALGRGWPVTMMGRDAPDSFRADLARRLGASYGSMQLEELGTPFDAADAPFDLLLECTGSEELLALSANALAPRAAAVWLAASRTPRVRSLDLSQVMRIGILRNHLHLGSVNAAPRDFDDALVRLAQFQERCPDAMSDLITKRVAPAESLDDFSRREPQGIKVVIDYT